jgi:hypothetical protein
MLMRPRSNTKATATSATGTIRSAKLFMVIP